MPLGAPPQLKLTPQTFDPLSGINLSNLNFPDFSKGLTALGSFVPDATAAAIAQTQKDTQKQTVDKLTSQILDQTPAKYWSGEGFGGAEANARALAGILYSNGITDTSQFAKRDTLKPLTDQNIVQYKLGNQGANKVVDPDTGETYYTTYDPSTDSGRRLTDAEVKKLTQVYGIPNYDEYGGYLPLSSSDIVTKDGKQYYKSGQEYYNKDTGIVIDTKKGLNDQYLSTPWSQTGNFFGKTYAGSGSTNYNVEFDAQGVPHFYTTYGGSSSDLGSISPIVSLLSVLPTPVQPFAIAANAAIAASQGNVLPALAAIAGIPGVSDAVGSGVTSALQTANQANNLVNAIQSGNIAGALAAGANLTGTGGTEIGDTGITVGQAAKGIGALQAAESGNIAPLIGSLVSSTGSSTGPKASDIEAGSFSPISGAFDPSTAGFLGTGKEIAAQQPVSTSLPSGWTPAIQDYSEQGGGGGGGYTDYSVNADYNLFPTSTRSPLEEMGGAQGIQAPELPSVFTPDGSVDYSLFTPTPTGGEPALQMPSTPNLDVMGGGQGLTTPAAGGEGTMTGAGLIPDNYVAPLGDPNSFINQPAPGGDVHDLVQKALEITGSTPSTGGTSTGTTKTSTPSTSTGISVADQVKSPLDLLPKFIEVKDPWLKTTKPSVDIGVKEEPLEQIYSSLDPFMTGKADGGSIFSDMHPELMEIFMSRLPAYADGGSTSTDTNPFDLMAQVAKDTSPKFVKQTPLFLKPQGSTKVAQLQALTQLGQVPRLGQGMARGGLPSKYEQAAPDGHNPEFVTGITGYYAGGRGTGQSDDIPAMLHDGDYVIDAEAVSALGDGSSKAGKDVLTNFLHQVPHKDGAEGNPVAAKIADGEFVLPSSFVTALGGGDNKHGAKLLDLMRERLRQHKRSAPLSKIPPKAKSPLDYLKGVKG